MTMFEDSEKRYLQSVKRIGRKELLKHLLLEVLLYFLARFYSPDSNGPLTPTPGPNELYERNELIFNYQRKSLLISILVKNKKVSRFH